MAVMPAQTHSRSSRRFVPYEVPAPDRRPVSAGWLARPAWTDGGVNPVQRYYSIAEMNATLEAYGYPLLRSPSLEPELQAGPRRPASEEWLDRPTWKDEGADPPQRYHSVAEINANREAHGRLPIGRAFAPPPPQLDQEDDSGQAVSDDAAHMRQGATIDNALPQGQITIPADATIAREADAAATAVLVAGAVEEGKKVLTNVGITRSVPAAKQNVRGKVASTKEEKNKAREIQYNDGLTRSAFIKSALAVHGLHDMYEIGSGSGPSFRMWWKGSVGGKANAPAIDTDSDFMDPLRDILARMQGSRSMSVSVLFDLDKIASYRVEQPLSAGFDPHLEVTFGTQVPRVSQFSTEDQLHGAKILELQRKWKCDDHHSENGGAGCCYRSVSAQHYTLTNWRLKMWSAAIIAGKATMETPPPELLDGGDISVKFKPRGLNGSRSASSMSSNSGTGDVTSLLATTMLPMAVMYMQQMTESFAARRSGPTLSHSVVAVPTTDSTGLETRHTGVPVGDEVLRCVQDFFAEQKIDLTAFVDVLVVHDFTPDIIPHVSIARLMEVLGGVTEGKALKFQLFCRSWYSWLTDIRASR
ncbi:hypothetical protein BC835DRAFT_1398076 [Cytidiella melzeri]|nr:hypothetical protein BC835DRAFT_1398076 [Cytidiella melzeri]